MLTWRLYSSRHPETCVHHPDITQVAHPSSRSNSVMHDLCGMLMGANVLWQLPSIPVAGLQDVKCLPIHRWERGDLWELSL